MGRPQDFTSRANYNWNREPIVASSSRFPAVRHERVSGCADERLTLAKRRLGRAPDLSAPSLLGGWEPTRLSNRTVPLSRGVAYESGLCALSTGSNFDDRRRGGQRDGTSSQRPQTPNTADFILTLTGRLTGGFSTDCLCGEIAAEKYDAATTMPKLV